MPEWVEVLLNNYGYPVIFLGVFLNNIGLPVPGDTLLLGAGWLCADGVFSLSWVITLGAFSCFLGGTLGYWMGRKAGPRFLLKSRWFRLKPERIDWMERFLKKHGAKAVFFARFVALVHPVTGLLAGMGRMPWRPFLFYNLAGSVAYAFCYASAGYFFGGSWDLLEGWAGKAAVYSLTSLLLFAVIVFFLRRPVSLFLERFFKNSK